MILKKYWVVRATLTVTGYQLYHEEATREGARDIKRSLRDTGKWEGIVMYRATERLYDDNSVHIVLGPAR